MKSNENKIESRSSSYENYIQANEFIWKDTESTWLKMKMILSQDGAQIKMSQSQDQAQMKIRLNQVWNENETKWRSGSYKSYTESSQMNQMTLTQVSVNENDTESRSSSYTNDSQIWVQMKIKQ